MKTLGEVLQAAIAFEKLGRQFYLDLAERVRDEKTKLVVELLAKDEDTHIRVIEQYYRALEEHGKAEAAPPSVPAQDIDKILRSTIGQLHADVAFEEVYERACDLERQSRDFYSAQAETAKDHTLAEFFRFLSITERTHLDALSLMLARGKAAG